MLVIKAETGWWTGSHGQKAGCRPHGGARRAISFCPCSSHLQNFPLQKPPQLLADTVSSEALFDLERLHHHRHPAAPPSLTPTHPPPQGYLRAARGTLTARHRAAGVRSSLAQPLQRAPDTCLQALSRQEAHFNFFISFLPSTVKMVQL